MEFSLFLTFLHLSFIALKMVCHRELIPSADSGNLKLICTAENNKKFMMYDH